MRQRQSNEIGFRRKTEDQTGLAHTAIRISAGVTIRVHLFVLMIMMTNVLGHRIMLVLTIRTHGRRSCLQRHHSDQNDGDECSHSGLSLTALLCSNLADPLAFETKRGL